MVKIITARPQQLQIVREIALVTWPHTFGEILSPPQIDYMLDMMYSPAALQQQTAEKGHVFLLADVDGIFGGFAAYELNYKQQPVSKLHKIYILPAMQGKQVGKALIHEVARIAREAGMQRLSLNVNRHNKATGFYERIGFSKTGEEDIDIGNGFVMNDTIMEMPL
ncbi:GNAT family N-acetyltransferase [Chitinophaga alhagiae]|uniref:GNAT family N-acetyltransferase n=1 Tax=Chitinophaga alhagiae TaxID=2203219 RepID=A0ABN5LUZ4_9BACT|nr:GNAT family N-acetyltransferase [Chitinophaga alhagiae]AWO01558.1 GNAT family N-acetyltransferase [Chitinophaga alhagiae]